MKLPASTCGTYLFITSSIPYAATMAAKPIAVLRSWSGLNADMDSVRSLILCIYSSANSTTTSLRVFSLMGKAPFVETNMSRYWAIPLAIALSATSLNNSMGISLFLTVLSRYSRSYFFDRSPIRFFKESNIDFCSSLISSNFIIFYSTLLQILLFQFL